MGFLSSLFGGRAPSTSSHDATKLAHVLSAYFQAANLSFLVDPLQEQIREPDKRMRIVSFFFGAADFFGHHVKQMPDDTVLAGFSSALEMGLDMSSSEAQKACDDAADWSGDPDGCSYMQQGASAFAEFMENGTPPSKFLRTLLMFPG